MRVRNDNKDNRSFDELAERQVSRRRFLAMSGAGLAGMYMLGFRPVVAEAKPMPADAPSTGQTLVVAWESGPIGMDHDINLAPRCYDVTRNTGVHTLTFAPMVVGEVFQPDFTKIVGEAAKEWKLNDDWSKISITLKEGIISSAGNELTADDVLYTYARSEHFNGMLWGFHKMATLIRSLDDLKKEGKYTYSIQMAGPNALGELIQAHEAEKIVDSVEYKKHDTEDDPWSMKWASSHYASFGAWKLTEWVPGDHWTYERNEKYFAPQEYGNVTKVVNKIIPSSANRVALLESGDVDIAFDLQASELLRLQKTSGVRVDNLAGNMLQWLGFNIPSKQSPQLEDVNVRLAIGYALPFDQLLERPYLGFAKQMTCSVAPAYAGYDQCAEIWGNRQRDMAKAKDYLAKSAYPKGFKTTLHYVIGMAGQEETAIIIKSALAELGIDVELVSIQTGDFWNLALRGAGFPGMFIFRDMAGTPDLTFGDHIWLKCTAVGYPGEYCSPEIDKLFAESQAIPGQFEKRVQLQKQVEDIAWNKNPIGVPLQALGFQAACRENIGGWMWHSLNEVTFTRAWKK